MNRCADDRARRRYIHICLMYLYICNIIYISTYTNIYAIVFIWIGVRREGATACCTLSPARLKQSCTSDMSQMCVCTCVSCIYTYTYNIHHLYVYSAQATGVAAGCASRIRAPTYIYNIFIYMCIYMYIWYIYNLCSYIGEQAMGSRSKLRIGYPSVCIHIQCICMRKYITCIIYIYREVSRRRGPAASCASGIRAPIYIYNIYVYMCIYIYIYNLRIYIGEQATGSRGKLRIGCPSAYIYTQHICIHVHMYLHL